MCQAKVIEEKLMLACLAERGASPRFQQGTLTSILSNNFLNNFLIMCQTLPKGRDSAGHLLSRSLNFAVKNIRKG